MTNRYSPTVRRRRLSDEIRRRRLQAHMTLDDAAKETEISRTTISNIESGEKKRPQVNEIKAMLEAYSVDDTREREAILTLCRQSRERGWWTRYRDVLHGRFIGFETEASVISNWEPLVVPGLLQLPEYTEIIAKASLVRDPNDIQRTVDARIERQRVIMHQDPPELWAVFGEGALLALADYPDVQRRQIEHLIEVAENPDYTTVQMTPHTALNPGMAGAFVIMDFPNTIDPSVVYLETDTDGLYLEEHAEVARYRHIFGYIRIAALSPEDTLARLREMIS